MSNIDHPSPWTVERLTAERDAALTHLAQLARERDVALAKLDRIECECVASLTSAGVAVLADTPTAPGEITIAIAKLARGRDAAVAEVAVCTKRLNGLSDDVLTLVRSTHADSRARAIRAVVAAQWGVACAMVMTWPQRPADYYVAGIARESLRHVASLPTAEQIVDGDA